jgi:hypothetical protein
MFHGITPAFISTLTIWIVGIILLLVAGSIIECVNSPGNSPKTTTSVARIAGEININIKFVLHVFFGKYHSDLLPKKAHEASLLMLISPAILATLVVVFGLFPGH